MFCALTAGKKRNKIKMNSLQGRGFLRVKLQNRVMRFFGMSRRKCKKGM